jgi:hypothetical protein
LVLGWLEVEHVSLTPDALERLRQLLQSQARADKPSSPE